MVATIVPDEGEHVWGAVWKLNIEDMKNLNRLVYINTVLILTYYVEITHFLLSGKNQSQKIFTNLLTSK